MNPRISNVKFGVLTATTAGADPLRWTESQLIACWAQILVPATASEGIYWGPSTDTWLEGTGIVPGAFYNLDPGGVEFDLSSLWFKSVAGAADVTAEIFYAQRA